MRGNLRAKDVSRDRKGEEGRTGGLSQQHLLIAVNEFEGKSSNINILLHITHLRGFYPPTVRWEGCLSLRGLDGFSFSFSVFVSVCFSLMDLLLVIGLCGFQVFNQGVNWSVTSWQLPDLCVKMESEA